MAYVVLQMTFLEVYLIIESSSLLTNKDPT